MSGEIMPYVAMLEVYWKGC